MGRTVIDSIRDDSKIGGFVELLNCLEGILYLDEAKLLRYLEVYSTQGLYQRVGYLLQRYQKEMQLSYAFFDYCKEKIGKSRRYLLNASNERSEYRIKTLEPIEIYGSKINALLSRAATKRNIKTDLLSVIKRKDNFELESAKKITKDYILSRH